MWVYQRENGASYDIVDRVRARTTPVSPPAFYAAEPPVADTAWPSENVAPRLRLLRYRDLSVYPRHVLVEPRQGRVLPVSFKKHRHHVHNGLIHRGEDHFELRDESLRLVIPQPLSRPVYLADTEYPGIFGHDLVEVFSAAWAWMSADGDALFATSTRPRRYLIDLLGAVGVPRESLFFFEAPLEAPVVLFPEAAVVARRYVHPVAFELFDRARQELGDEHAVTPERIYLSRSRVGDRSLVNEAAVEDLVRERGFEVIHPQEHSIAEQITLFSRAKLIMGTGGSAMHNAVFAAADARVLLLSSRAWLTVIDSLLDAGHDRLGYVLGEPTVDDALARRRHKGPWTIDLNDVRQGMRQHFDL